MGLGISSNIFVPASLIFDDGCLHLNLDLRNISHKLPTQLNYDEPLQSMLNPCSATKEQGEAWSAVDELLHQQIGGSSYAVGLGP